MKPKERVSEVSEGGGPGQGTNWHPLSWFWIAYFALDSTVNVVPRPAFVGFDHFQPASCIFIQLAVPCTVFPLVSTY